MKPALERLDGDSELGGGFRGAPLLDVAEQDDFPMRRIEVGECSREQRDALPQRDGIGRNWRGRSHVCFGGITISRFEAGVIVEDWSVIDTLALASQLGLWHTILMGIRQRRVIATARANALPRS